MMIVSMTNPPDCSAYSAFRCNFSDMEIEMFFAKYDTDGNRLLEADEVRRMLADLEGQKSELDSEYMAKERSL